MLQQADLGTVQGKRQIKEFTPLERKREREVLQKGKGRSFPWLSYHSDRQSQCVYEYLTECFVFFLSHAVSITTEGLWRLAIF